MRAVLLSAALLILLDGLLATPAPAKVCQTEACKEMANRLLSYMDPSIDKCDNFYKFACGKFLATAEIPPDQAVTDTFSEVNDRLAEQLKAIVLEPPKDDEPKPVQMMKTIFSLCMDEAKMDSKGVTPVTERLKQAGGWPVLGDWNKDNWNFMATEIKLRELLIGGGSFFKVAKTVDPKNNKRRILMVDQPCLDLPQEYMVQGMENEKVKKLYDFMVDIAVLYGADKEKAKEQQKAVLELEIKLAGIVTKRQDRRNRDRMYNLYDLQKLNQEFPWIKWKELFEVNKPEDFVIRDDEPVIVNEVEYLHKLKDLLDKTPDEVKANFMMIDAASGHMKQLTNAMRDRVEQYNREAFGVKQRKPRWKECLSYASSLGIAASSLYVNKFVDKSTKPAAIEMANHIRKVFAKDLKEVPWMDEKTRQRAEDKLAKMDAYIGYPEELTDPKKIEEAYEGLEINKDDFFEAGRDLGRWYYKRKFKKFREPYNKKDWKNHSIVTGINTYVSYNENAIEVPAGILQPPFFSAQLPNYINYGRMGYPVAREFTQGFDVRGCQYNADGELENWWEENTKKEFDRRVQCVIDQFDQIVDGETNEKLNGVNTQGVAMSDLGGLQLAYRAYRQLASETPPEPLLPGLEDYTPDQLFMLSAANTWCRKERVQVRKEGIKVGRFPPNEHRVNGAIKNIREFKEIFGCKKPAGMNIENVCEFW